MKTIEVKAESNISEILIGERITNLGNYLPDGKKAIITDANIIRYYRNKFPENIPVIEIGLGEENKTLQTIENIFDRFIEYEVDRTTFIIGIGGGIVCDIAGFAASTFMRGTSFGFVSTTLLSQVDASVGGKNGVNFRKFKNMIGVFNQPDFVICDESMLNTLEPNEFRAGFAEIVKAGAIRNEDLFAYLEENYHKALQIDAETIIHLVYESVKMKADIVGQDEKEKGLRRILNFGHTFAHSIEKLTGKLHGEAVSIGMVLAAKVSEKLGLINKEDTVRIIRLLENLQLPTKPEFDVIKLYDSMKLDKKREGDSIHLVLINKIGNAVIHKVSYNELEKIIYDLRSDLR